MVILTRSLKRKLEYNLEEITNCDKNLKINNDVDSNNDSMDDFINNNETLSEASTENFDEDEYEDEDEDEYEDIVYSIYSDEEEEEENEEEDKDEEDEDEEEGDDEILSKKIHKMKLRKQIKNIFNQVYIKNKENKDEYDKFQEYIDNVYNGTFFEKYDLSNEIKDLKQNIEITRIAELNKILEQLKLNYKSSTNEIVDILEMDISIEKKQKILEKIYQIVNTEILTPEYNTLLKELQNIVLHQDSQELLDLEKQILSNINNNNDSYKDKILKSSMSFDNKVIAYKFMKIMDSYGSNSSSEEHIKYKTWLNTLLSIPFGQYHDSGITVNSPIVDIQNYITNIRETLDKKLSFLEKPKDQIINIISQIVRNPESHINAIGLYGVKGTGKSSISDSISEALGRPLKKISLGGSSDSSILTGNNFTYIGSKQGRIVDSIIDSKIMNPILLIDEIDKISTTEHGKELIGSLVHLTDTTTNKKYNCDNYLGGIELDLSRILFIFTYNEPKKVDKILADRIFKIKINNYNIKEKFEITNKHLINNILKAFNFKKEDISFSSESIQYLVDMSNNDEGMRSIKSKIQIIISRINTLLLTDNTKNIINLKYKTLYTVYNKLPIIIQKKHINLLLEDSLTDDKESGKPPEFMYT